MRIAVVHSFYRAASPSGENTVVDEQVAALRSAGHEVLLVARRSDEVRGGLLGPAKAAWDVSTGSGFDPSAQLHEFAPDVVHVHNLFPNFATDWLATWPGPLVATLHNYRPVCANGLLLRDGHVCTLCPDGDPWAGVKHACYRDSRLATAPLAIRSRRGIHHDPLLARADRIIVLSDVAQDLYARFGLPASRMTLVPNGIEVGPQTTVTGRGCVAFGRLTPEKNWMALVAEWPAEEPLDVFGSGPVADQLAAVAPDSVTLRGSLTHSELVARLPRYRVAVFSGVNPEGAYPLTALEAWSAGLSLVARQGGAVATMVGRWGGGTVFRGAADLPRALEEAATVAPAEVRRIVRDHFSQEAWTAALLDVYTQVRSR